MTWLDAFLDTAVVQRLGWTLMHSLWQVAAVAAGMAVGLVALRRATANARYLAALLTLGAMAAAPAVTFVLVPVEPAPQPVTDMWALEPSATLPPAPATTNVATDSPPALGPIIDPPPPAAPLADEPAPVATAVASAEPSPPQQVTLGERLAPALPYVVAAWLVGVVLLSGRLMIGCAQARRIARAARWPLADPWQQRLADLALRLGVTRPVRLVESGPAGGATYIALRTTGPADARPPTR